MDYWIDPHLKSRSNLHGRHAAADEDDPFDEGALIQKAQKLEADQQQAAKADEGTVFPDAKQGGE